MGDARTTPSEETPRVRELGEYLSDLEGRIDKLEGKDIAIEAQNATLSRSIEAIAAYDPVAADWMSRARPLSAPLMSDLRLDGA